MAADLLRERLPPDWSFGVTGDGRVFFISERQRTTSWLHPVTGRPVQTGHQAAPGLPNGWEQDYTPEGATYFIDHNNQQTTFGHPITGRPVSEEDPPPPPRSPPQSPTEKVDFKRGTVKQRSLKAPSAKRNPSSQVVRKGYLYRLESGGLAKTWKRRWIVLADFALFIYKNDEEKTSLGSILLPSYRIVACTAEDLVLKDFAFKVEHENTKTEYFHTDSLSDLNDWLPHLQQAAAMKGNVGFFREANNNVQQMSQRSPPYSHPHRDHPDKWGGSHPNLDSQLETQWRNPNPNQSLYAGKKPSSPNNNLGAQPAWRSVPSLGGENVSPRNGPREMTYDPQGSLWSLPQEVYRNRQDGAPRNSGFPQDQLYHPQAGNGFVNDRDPKGSLRSLPNDAYRQEFLSASPMEPGGSSRDVSRDRDAYPLGGLQPYQRPNDSQRSSMVSDPGRHDVDHGSYNVQQPQRNAPAGPYHPNYSNHNRMRSDPRDHRPHDLSADSMGSYRPDHSRERSDGSREGSLRDRRDGEYSPNASHPGDGRAFPESNSRMYTAQDPRASYASSGRHSLASHNHSYEQDPRQNSQSHQQPHHGSRSSLNRGPPGGPPSSHSQSFHPPPHDVHSHTYVNVPEMRNSALEHQESLPPQRPPYPVAVRDQIVKELADNRSPATAEMMMRSHEINKERMQQSPFFQYPTPPKDQPVSRLDDRDGRVLDPVKRLSQYSDRNSIASGGVPGDRGSRSQRGSSDYIDSGRRQDSGSGQFSDSFERSSADDRRTDDSRRQGPGAGRMPNERDVPMGRRFGGDPEAKSLRQAYERVASFRESSAAARGEKRSIQTVREEPDMPDSEVLETRMKKKYPLNGVRLRMSISAGDLIGKTHDELVLLLIQLRRNQAALEKARNFYREVLNKRRPAEREYRRQRHDSVGRLDRSVEEEHQSFIDTRSQLEEIEKKLEVYRPLINLVDNMVTMGSLYGGDNLMLATQYRKHLLRPDQYQPPRKMLEFSRKHQEEKVIASIEADVRQLTAAEVDLEEKIDRLNQLERLLQEQSFKVSSFREDKELLEKALLGILKQQKEYQDSPHELRRLLQQAASVEKELSRVTQDLAEASKALEETTVETNKIEHEVALLRTKVHGELKRSKSAPSLVTENANAKVKMERELARVQNMLQGLSQQGEKLSNAMSTIRRSSSGTQLAAAFDATEKTKKAGTYMQTDLDSGEQIDLAQQIPLQSPTSPDSVTSDGHPVISHQRQESTYGVSSVNDADSSREWDIGDADDNTKRFYGLLPKEKPRGLTVRDVKRQSEQRRERKRDEEGHEVALKVSSTDSEMSTFIHTRYPSYTSSQSSGLDLVVRDPSGPLYENLPRSGSMPALNNSSSGPDLRRPSIALMAPKPFVPYQDRTAKPFRSELALNTAEQTRGPGFSEQNGGKPFASELALNSSGARLSGVQQDPIGAGHVGLVTARPLRIGPPADVTGRQQGTAQPSFTHSTQLYNSSAQRHPYETSPDSLSSSRPVVEGGFQSGLYDVKKSPKGRYMTVSSSEPTRLEPETFKSPSRVDDVPDVVKSSLTNVDNIDQIDVDAIDREILYLPEKVLIPERYDPEADAEQLTEAERLERQEKSERIKRLLTDQSVLSISQPDVHHVPPSQLHNQVMREKRERAQLLTLGQELARQVTQQSKKAAAERRKTWSGGQIADIKKEYEAELAANPDQFNSSSRTVRQAKVLL